MPRSSARDLRPDHPSGGDINRPNGSGAGKTRLYGPANVADVDFARSSSSLNANETNASLQQFPFALDVMAMAVSKNVASNAPASLTIAQIVQIYKGEVTNWTELGGTAGVIEPLAADLLRHLLLLQRPADGRQRWRADHLAGTVTDVQEHDDTPIKNDANAIAPFSVGRAGLLGNTLQIEGGWTAQRALYNVVRGASLSDPKVTAVFGPNGFFCSDEVTNLINDYGFGQLAREGDGGVCGVATQAATSNFTVNAPPVPVPTTTIVTGTSTGAGKARLVATVAPSAEGTVTFTEGENVLDEDVPLIGGTATANLTGLTPGTHEVRRPSSPTRPPAFVESEDSGDVVVKAASTIAETFPATVKKGKVAKGTVTVTLVGTDAKATGKVTVKKGKKTVGSGNLANGKVTITLNALPKGENKLVIKWDGNAVGVKSSKRITITQK